MGFVEDVYAEMYPQLFRSGGLVNPIEGYTLREVRIRPVFSEVHPLGADLSSQIGPVKLNFPLLSAAMDAVSGPDMAKALFEVGGCGVLYRDPEAKVQLDWLEEALTHKPCLVSEPKSLHQDQTLANVQDILEKFGFSTIPIIGRNRVLVGVIFTSEISFKKHLSDPIKKWMKPRSQLKVEKVDTPFETIKNRLLNEQECSVLPILDGKNRFQGIYFMKDFFVADPTFYNDKPLVGIAIGTEKSDLERAYQALEMGAGIIVVDSSHGNCPDVIRQTEEAVKAVVERANGRAAVIGGNVADIDGYYRLAQAGAHGVKPGIGPGSICTTSQVTGAGVPMFTLIRELDFIRQKMGANAPAIIPDGSIEGPGDMVIALAAGGDVCMAGKWLVAASESFSCRTYGVDNEGFVQYWGMASSKAIKARMSRSRYQGKTAPEGVEGRVRHRGPLRTWIGGDIELIQGGFAHAGAANLAALHEFGNRPIAFVRFTQAGQQQIGTRLD
ncbi:MAG: IMP dehydrogenase [Patescibacteria group bacterium]|nr:IMP dehydrogenase [Patescibacteria group bacterium]MDD5294524.1 IMP dehydrogenase [Patescibacteria group bacterium]MDD5554728.1 IMP dehydrogenase [Patescibacteria group bacterium]